MNNVLTNYVNAKKELFDHVGLRPDWIEYAIEPCDEYHWSCDGETVIYADTLEEYIARDGDYYSDDVYTQRFYKKHVYRGKDYTLIFCDPHTDGVKWFKIFSNKLEVKHEH